MSSRGPQLRQQPTHATQTVTSTAQEPDIPEVPHIPDGTLRLRGAPVHERRVVWAEDVIDNEGLGRKSSKVCCIYHKPRAMGESSDESSSESSSDSDSEPDTSGARPSRRLAERKGALKAQQHDHDCSSHEHEHKEEDSGDESEAGPSSPRRSAHRPRRKRSPNAYEKIPKAKPST